MHRAGFGSNLEPAVSKGGRLSVLRELRPARRKVAVSDKASYAIGWVVQQTSNGTIVWHNGGTTSFGSYFGLLPDRDVGVVVLANEVNVGLSDALG
jgi:CubicO group peptidase (beta-lactamase class C family)